MPIDNHWGESRIRRIAIGCSDGCFARSQRAGQRAAAVMNLIQAARLNGQARYAYLEDVLERLPTQPASCIGELPPHRWPATAHS